MLMKYMKTVAFSMLFILIVVLMFATWVEKMSGSALSIYGSWWFASLWAFLAVVSLLYIFQRQMQKRPVLFLLHLSFLVILSGALVTHIWGKQGSVHLRQGLPERMFVLSNQHTEMLPFPLMLEDFEVQYYADMKSPKDFVSEVKVEDEILTISMNHIGRVGGYRLYQSSYDADLRGTVLSVSYDPWGIGITYVGYGLLFVSMIVILIRILWSSGLLVIKRFAISVSVLAILSYVLYQWCMRAYSDGYLPPVLRSPLLTVHVGIIMVAYVLLIVLFLIGIVALVMKDQVIVQKLHMTSRKLLFPALFCLIAGIFIGAIWANLSWGRYWGWDPKEVWALITMLVYSFAFHSQSLPIFQKPKYHHLFMVLAFLSVLMTYFGVNFLLGGMHSYGS